MKPFLKWAGGKSKLVPQILDALLGEDRSGHRKRLVEPFVGSGALVMGISQDERADRFFGYVCSDVNSDLIHLYRHLAADPEGFVELARSFFEGGVNNNVDDYIRLRSVFNETPMGDRLRSALFVYLNRHCFNGLCRYNSTGGFNVPFGRGANARTGQSPPPPGFPGDAMLCFAETSRRVEWRAQDFDAAFREVRSGDVVYCDPPYSPLSVTASFSAYATGAFTDQDHGRLADLARAAADEHGATVVVSNHWSEDIQSRLYSDADDVVRLSVARSVSAASTSRVEAQELLAVYRPSGRPGISRISRISAAQRLLRPVPATLGELFAEAA